MKASNAEILLSSTLNEIRKISLFSLMRAIFGLLGLFYFQTSLFVHYLRPPALFQVALFDIALLHSNIFLNAANLICLISLILFIIGYRVEITGLVAGLTKFIFLIAYLEGVLAFSYLLPLGWMAFSFTALMQKKETRRNCEIPIALLIASVFICAGLEKLVHYNVMEGNFQWDLVRYFRPGFLYYCPNSICPLMTLASWTVIPFELVIGILFLFYRTRKLAFLLNSLFILTLFAFLKLRHVGYMLFILQLSIGFLRSQWTIDDVIKNKRLKWVFLSFFICTFLFFIIPSAEKDYLLLYKDTFDNFLIFFSLALFSYMAINEYLDQEKDSLLSYWTWPTAYLLILVLFALVPQIDQYKKTHQFGWSMFSGATAGKPLYQFKLRRNGCPTPPNYSPLIYKTFLGNQNAELYSSFSDELLNRYSLELKKNCPMAETSKIFIYFRDAKSR